MSIQAEQAEEAGGPLWRKASVLAYTGLSDPELYRRLKAGTFPKPLKLGPQSVAWQAAVVKGWVRALVQQQEAK